jgi:branched-chain amino acid transport system permease protein
MNAQAVLLQLVTGIGTAALLMLVAAGFTITFGLQRIINISHGALYMLGAFLAVELARLKLPMWAGLLIVFACVGLLGVVIQRAILHRLRGADHLVQVLATLGVSVLVQELLRLRLGATAQTLEIPDSLAGVLTVGTLVYPTYFVFVIAFAAALMLVLWFVFSRTKAGLTVRAVALDANMALAVGINVPVVQLLTFGVGAGLAGVGGALAGPLFAVHPSMDLDITPMVFAVTIFGGVGDVRGAVLGALVTGLILSFGTAYLSSTVAMLTVFMLMALTVSLRPQGLFGVQEVRR